MGKKRSKKSDFQKVKLKVGRSLPKGLNVTCPKFKSKKIKVPGQFKPIADEPRTHRHQTIADFLKKCHHSSVSVRHEAFIDMGKLLRSHKDLIETYLSTILEITSSGFHDDSSSVRNEAVNICALVLENVSEMKISAFSAVLLPHICCAMTNINNAIRVDSLKVLDLCLDTIPSVITSSEKILKNFLLQISFERSQPVSMKGGFKVSQMPVNTSSERLKSLNWRASVLSTLAKFLKAVILCLSKKESGYFWPTFFSPIKIPGMDFKITEFSDIKSYITSLMPILMNVWIEAAPMPYTKSDSGEIVSAEAAHIMDGVLQVIRLICEWLKNTDENNNNIDMITWFDSKYRKSLFGRLMVWFPYSCRASTGRKKWNTDTEISCLTVNLAICDVFASMPPKESIVSTKLFQQINEYLLQVINRDNSGGVASISIIVKILEKFLATSKLEFFEAHLNGLLKRFGYIEDGKKERQIFLDFIIDMVLDFKNKDILGSMPMMQNLVHSLIVDLVKMQQKQHVDEHTLAVIKQLSAIGFLPFVNELQQNSLLLIDLIQSEVPEIQNVTVFLMSRLTDIPVDIFLKLAEALYNPAVQNKTIVRLLSTLSDGLRKPLHIPAYTGRDYTNFLFSIAIGMFKQETDMYMNKVQEEQERLGKIIPFQISEYSVARSEDLHRHFTITQIAIKALMNFPDEKQMSQCIRKFVMEFTTNCAYFPSHTALALLLLEVEAYKVDLPDDMDYSYSIAEIIIASFLYQIAWEHETEIPEIPSGSILGALLSILEVLKNTDHVCNIICQRIRELQTMKQAECIVRLMLIILRKQLLLPDFSLIINILQELHEQFGSDILDQSWWVSINREISMPPYCNG